MARTPAAIVRLLPRALAGLVAATLVSAGCTSDRGSEEPPTPSSVTLSPPPTVSSTAYVFTDEIGIEAHLTVRERGAVLRISNRTDASLPAPGIYVLDARDGTRADWTVVDAARIRAGSTEEFVVRRLPTPPADQIGLIAMLFGGEDLGAFVPPRTADDPDGEPEEGGTR
jgi:hypothetical protein